MWPLDTPCGNRPHQAQAQAAEPRELPSAGWLGVAGREQRRALWQEIGAEGLNRQRARQLLEACGCAPAGPETLLLGLSGGADSVLLLALVARAELSGRVQVIHARHGLRGRESARDAAFCRWLCRRLGLAAHFPRAPVAPGSNLEARARDARRWAFGAVLKGLRGQARGSYSSGSDDPVPPPPAAGPGSPWLLLGHTGQDHAETVLWRWLRGSSLAAVGLADTPESPSPEAPHTHGAHAALKNTAPWRPLRPLSDLSREEVRQLGQALGLCWREDSSNRSPAHARNRLRLRLLPALATAQATSASPAAIKAIPVGEFRNSASAKRRVFDAGTPRPAPGILADNAALNALQQLGQASWEFEAELRRWLPNVSWAPTVWSSALFDPCASPALELDPDSLRGLSAMLLERLLRRLCWQATGGEPGRALLSASAALLGSPEPAASPWPGGHVLWARPGHWCLLPPFPAGPWPPGKPAVTELLPEPEDPCQSASDGHSRRAPAPESGHCARSWIWRLADGRRLSASLADAPASTPGALVLELSSSGLDLELEPAPAKLHLPPGPQGKPRVGELAAQAGIPPRARRRLCLLRDSLGPLWIPGLWQRTPGLGNSRVPMRVSLDWPGPPERSTAAPAPGIRSNPPRPQR